MNKLKLACIAGMALVSCGHDVWANEAGKSLEKTLTILYGAPVEVDITGETCKVRYPETKIEDEKMQYVPPATPDGQPSFEKKTETTIIAETMPECKKIDDFYGKSQYKITKTSADSYIAQLYNLTSLALWKDLEIKTFNEEITVVPEIGLISSDKLHIADVSYVEKDETTGLKSELGNLKEITYDQKITRDKNNLKYRLDSKLDMLNLALPFFSIQVKSSQSAAEVDYQITAEDKFDYSNIMQNLMFLTHSRSRSVGKGVKIDAGFFGVEMAFDFENKNNVELKSLSKAFDFSGNVLMKNVAFTGEGIEKSKQFQSMALSYNLKEIPYNSVVKIAEIQKKHLELAEKAVQGDDKEKLSGQLYDEEEFTKILDEMFDKASLIMEAKVKFAGSDIVCHFDLKRKNGYLSGEGKITVNNLYGIFPEKKQCLNNPSADTIPECQEASLFSSLSGYIDTTKNNSINVYRYNEKGIFRGNEKVGEPIELNFQKMYQEQQRRKQEQEERMKQLMDMQKNVSEQKDENVNK